MSTKINVYSAAITREAWLLLVISGLLIGAAYGQQNQSDNAAGTVEANKVADAIERAAQDGPESIYFVEQVAEANAVQAIPMLEKKFMVTKDPLDKAHIASALVRLGDKNGIYWDFLAKLATEAAESNALESMSHDPQDKPAPGPSTELVAWAKSQNLSLEAAADKQAYLYPGAVGLLALTGDARAVPVLRQALSSPNFVIQALAAEGLAGIHDESSVPLIIEACKKAPAEVAALIARSLVYFDDPEAQEAVDEYVPKDAAKIYREARAQGKKPLSN